MVEAKIINMHVFVIHRFVSRRTEKLLLSLVKDVTKHRMETDEIRNDLFQHMITLKKTDTTGCEFIFSIFLKEVSK